MAEHLTPEKIEHGRKLLQQATPGPFRYDRLAIHHSITIDGKPAEWNRVVEDRKAEMFENHVMCGLASTRGKYEQEEANGKYIAWLLNNAPALLAAAELGMAWEEEAKAARAWCERDTLDTRATEVTRAAYLKAMDHTDKLTGRIGE